jgi:hypothetical protein
MTENIYQRGQIYAIRSHQTNLIYIGSTIQPLHVRFGGHKKPSNECKSSEILKYTDSYIELLELFPCNSKKELNRQEGKWIRQLECVNKYIAGRTKKEFNLENKDKRKKWNAENKEQIAKRKAKYNAEHKEEIAKQQAKYNAEHKEQLEKYQAKYYAENKERNAKNREQINERRRANYKASKLMIQTEEQAVE